MVDFAFRFVWLSSLLVAPLTLSTACQSNNDTTATEGRNDGGTLDGALGGGDDAQTDHGGCANYLDCMAPTPHCKIVASDQSMNTCVECLDTSDCATTYICTDNACVLPPAECYQDADCQSAKPKCKTHSTDLTMNLCVECLVDADCATALICEDNLCEIDEG